MFANRTIGGVRIPCVAIYVIVVFAIVLYGHYLRKTETKDILERKIIDHPSCPGFDGWACSHFLLFGLLGFLFPGHHVQALVVSLGWEGVEHFLGTNNLEFSGKRLQLIGDQDEDGRPIKSEKPAYWYGRFVTDNSFNLSGYILGSAIASRWWPNKD